MLKSTSYKRLCIIRFFFIISFLLGSMLTPTNCVQSSEVQSENYLKHKSRTLEGKEKQAYEEFDSTISRVIEYTQRNDSLDKKNDGEISIKLRKLQEDILDLILSPLLVSLETYKRSKGARDIELTALQTSYTNSDPKYYVRLAQINDDEYKKRLYHRSTADLPLYVIIGNSEKDVNEIWEKFVYFYHSRAIENSLKNLFDQEMLPGK